MKKIAVLVLFVILSSMLIAATPRETGSSSIGSASIGTARAATRWCYDPARHKWVPCAKLRYLFKVPNQGEPTMEKVSIIGLIMSVGPGLWNYRCQQYGVWSFGCYWMYYCIRYYYLPVGCNFRYQY